MAEDDDHGCIAARVRTMLGIDKIHTWQYKVCNVLLGKKDCLLSVPTGGGKTLSFYLPLFAHWAPGDKTPEYQKVVLIVSPLVKLKANELSRVGIPAVAICSDTMHEGDVLKVWRLMGD
ncbi:hypothetical protein K439DRAFT_1623463 [Ramaria rubella]|nr:hypothetical protein K439DRAFT_1623463 [Ramaria rubella]